MTESFFRCGEWDGRPVEYVENLGIYEETPGEFDDILLTPDLEIDLEIDDEVIIEVESPYVTDPSKGLEILAKGYKRWAERYLYQCAGQKKHKHQERRMSKWDTILQTHLDNASGKYCLTLANLLLYFFLLETVAGWRILRDVVCTEYDLHRLDSMVPASSIDACIKQCDGFFN